MKHTSAARGLLAFLALLSFMAAWAVCLAYFLFFSRTHAATVSGSVLDASGQPISKARIEFQPISNPQVEGGAVILSAPIKITAATNGLFTTTLAQGDYTVTIQGGDTIQISVPQTTNTYNLQDLTTTLLHYDYVRVPVTGPDDWYAAAATLNLATSNALQSQISGFTAGVSSSTLNSASNVLQGQITTNFFGTTGALNTVSNLLQLQISASTNGVSVATLNATSNVLTGQVNATSNGLQTQITTGFTGPGGALITTSNALQAQITSGGASVAQLNSASNILQGQISVGFSGAGGALNTVSNVLQTNVTAIHSALVTSINNASNTVASLAAAGDAGLTGQLTTTSNVLQGQITTNFFGTTGALNTVSNLLQLQISAGSSGVSVSTLNNASNILQGQITVGFATVGGTVNTVSNILQTNITANVGALNTSINVASNALLSLLTVGDNLSAGLVTTASNALQSQIAAGFTGPSGYLIATSNALQAQITGGGATVSQLTTASNVLQGQITVGFTGSDGALNTVSNILEGHITTAAGMVVGVAVVPTVASLITQTTSIVITKGYWADGDGGDGTYVRVNSITSTNHGSKIASTTSGWSYQLVDNGVVNVLQWGAKRDGVTSATARINEAFAWNGTQFPRKTLLIPPGTYSLSSKLLLSYGDVQLRQLGNLKLANSVNDSCLWLGDIQSGITITAGIPAYTTSRITVDGEGVGTIDQNCQNSPTQDFSTSQHCILAYGIDGLTIKNLLVTNTVAWAMSIELCANAEVLSSRVVTGQENNVTASGQPRDFGGQDGIHFHDVAKGLIEACDVISGDDAIAVTAARTRSCGNVQIVNNRATVRSRAYAADGTTPQTNNASGRFALACYVSASSSHCAITNVTFALNAIPGGSGLFCVYDEGVAHAGKPTNVRFIGNTWSGQTDPGAVGGTSTGVDNGWFIAGSENLIFESNTFQDVRRWGLITSGSGYSANGLITFRQNVFKEFGVPYPTTFFTSESPAVLWINSATSVVIEGNHFLDNQIAPIGVGTYAVVSTNQFESISVNRNTFVRNNLRWAGGTGAVTDRHAILFANGVNNINFNDNLVATNYGQVFLGKANRRFRANANGIESIGNGSFTADGTVFDFTTDTTPMLETTITANTVIGADGRFISGVNLGNLVVMHNSGRDLQRGHSGDYLISYTVNAATVSDPPFVNFGGYINGNNFLLGSSAVPILVDSSIDASAYSGRKLRSVDSYNYYPGTANTNTVTSNASALVVLQ